MRSLPLTAKTYKRIAQYAEIAEISIEQAANEAIDKWMDETGDSVISFMKSRRSKSRESKPQMGTVPIRVALVSREVHTRIA